MWWYGPCSAWGCWATLSTGEKATAVYELQEQISCRANQVYRARNKGTGEIVALKVINRNTLKSVKQRRRIRREVHLLSKIQHPNLVRLYGVFESTNTVK